MSIILTINAGSTNTKLAAFDSKTLERKGHAVTHSAAETAEWICSIGEFKIEAVGHRVVHGGRVFPGPAFISEDVIGQIEHNIPLAPLHQKTSLRWIHDAAKLYPGIPHIACFDTAFHHTMPELERKLALPQWYYDNGIQRYGFHGLSYQSIAHALPKYLGRKADECIIAVHLGGGASACAMRERKSIATTMGFSTLDGMMMSTRCGSLDAGAVLYLLKDLEMKYEEVERLLYLESGLLGVSGVSSSMKLLLKSDAPQAKKAIELYCHLAAKQIAGLLPALGGLDALVFTGGIGENAAPVREEITRLLHFAGKFQTLVIPSDEEWVIASVCQNHLLRMPAYAG